MLSGTDFDFGYSLSTPDGYEINDIDLSSTVASTAALMREAAGMGENVSGIATKENNTYGSTGQEKARQRRLATERTIALIASNNEAAKRLNKLSKDISDLKNAIGDLLDSGLIDKQQYVEFIERAEHFETRLENIRNDISENRETARQQEQYIYDSLDPLGPEAKELMTTLLQDGKQLITVGLTIDGSIQRHVVYQDENGEHYVLIDNEKYLLKNHPDKQELEAAKNDIDVQSKNGEKLGNDDIEFTQNFLEKQQRWLEFSKEHGLEDQRNEIVKAFGALMKTEKEYQNLLKELETLEKDFAQFKAEIKNLTNKAALEQERQFEEQREGLVKRINAVRNSSDEHSEYLKEQVRLAIESRYKLAQIQALNDEVSQVMEGFETRGEHLRSLYLTSPLKLIDAQNNPITTPDGQLVHQDIKHPELKLYTYNTETGEKTYLTDTLLIAQLNHRAYVGGELFANETWSSEDPNNAFTSTFNADAETNTILHANEENESQAEAHVKHHEDIVQSAQTPKLKSLYAEAACDHEHSQPTHGERSVLTKNNTFGQAVDGTTHTESGPAQGEKAPASTVNLPG